MKKNIKRDVKIICKIFISTINNIFYFNLIIINCCVSLVSLCRSFSKRLRGTEFSSLENIPDLKNSFYFSFLVIGYSLPECVPNRHLLSYIEGLPEALANNFLITKYPDIVTGQYRVRTCDLSGQNSELSLRSWTDLSGTVVWLLVEEGRC